MLHILNGDGTADKFRQADLPGEVLVWREILSEGPAVYRGGEAAFWQRRQEYITQTYGETEANYKQKVLAELEQLDQVYKQHEEIILWFEHDLLCQINLVYLLHWFRDKPLQPNQLQLICINDHPEVPGFRGLGNLTPVQLAGLLPTRKILTTDDLETASRVWQAYTAANPLLLQQLAGSPLAELTFLPKALSAHLQRFPSARNGLNFIEETLLHLISQKPLPAPDLFEAFWQQETIFGVGDAQLLIYLKSLEAAGLIEFTTVYTLTAFGEKVLAGEKDYVKIRPFYRWLGGVYLQPGAPDWRWDDIFKQITRR